MRQVCYICGILYGLKEPYDNDAETSGICDECLPLEIERLKKEREEIKREKNAVQSKRNCKRHP